MEAPAAAMVPSRVAMRAERVARIRVFSRACMVSRLVNSSTYHFREKPVNTAVLLLALKEKKTITSRGA